MSKRRIDVAVPMGKPLNRYFTSSVDKAPSDADLVLCAAVGPEKINQCTNFGVGISKPDGLFYIAALKVLPNCAVYFAPTLAMQLGLPFSGPFDTRHPIRAIRPVDLTLGKPEQMYIYMNILKDQIVGHARATLLRTVPMSSEAI